jgi:hypothetical protein
MAADAEAAEAMSDGRLRVAEALLSFARISQTPSPGVSFTDGDLETRVKALLDDRRFLAWPARVLVLSAWVLPAVIGVSHDLIHHGLETLLGALS